ncbi:aromatic motif membrane protein [Ureaplasma canigenitalium]|uniref:aromatic motif membrane protein n=1 Tax=Ureaplasma canigenitalium TaxID=42092 RepID=UPI0004E25FC5|nr:aromatic motif membrane protein [Ureaplasma canigenitalium]
MTQKQNKALKLFGIVASACIASSIAIGLGVSFGQKQNVNQSSLHEDQVETENEKRIRENKAFRNQPIVKRLLNEMYEDSEGIPDTTTISENLFKWNKLPIQNFSDVKLSLHYYKPHTSQNLEDKLNTEREESANPGLNNTRKYRKNKQRARDILVRNFTENWYWVLQYLNYFEFNYWPWHQNLYFNFKDVDLNRSPNEGSEQPYYKEKLTEENYLFDDQSITKIVAKYNDEKKALTFDANQLKLGYVYQVASVNSLDNVDSEHYLYDNRKLTTSKRIINRLLIYDSAEKKLNLYLDTKNNTTNDVKGIFLNRQTGEETELEAVRVNTDGVFKFDVTGLNKRDGFSMVGVTVDGIRHDELLTKQHKRHYVAGDEIYKQTLAPIDNNIELDAKGIGETTVFLTHYLEKDYIYKQTSNHIVNFHRVKIKKKSYDKYDKEVFYIQLENNSIIRLLKFKTGNTVRERLDFDVFVFPEPIENLAAIANEMEDIIQTKFNEYLIQKGIMDKDTGALKDVIIKDSFGFDDYNTKKEYEKLEEQNYLVNTGSRWQGFNAYVFRHLYHKYKAKMFTIASIDSNVLFRIRNSNEEQQGSQNHKIPDRYTSFVDPKLNIRDKKETPQQKKHKSIIETILDFAFAGYGRSEREVKKVEYINQQNDPAYQKQIIEELKKYAKEFGSILDPGPEVEKAFDDHFSNNRYAEYARFLTKNWYFVLNNLDKFALHQIAWFFLPDSRNKDNKDEILKMSPQYRKKLPRTPFPDRGFYNTLLDQLIESDESKEHGTALKKEFYLAKDKAIIQIEFGHEGSPIIMKPYGIVFAQSKLPPSIPIITNAFHNSFKHGDPKGYIFYEKQVIPKFGIPAKMILLWKDGLKDVEI